MSWVLHGIHARCTPTKFICKLLTRLSLDELCKNETGKARTKGPFGHKNESVQGDQAAQDEPDKTTRHASKHRCQTLFSVYAAMIMPSSSPPLTRLRASQKTVENHIPAWCQTFHTSHNFC